jgi:hypothetical protein
MHPLAVFERPLERGPAIVVDHSAR